MDLENAHKQVITLANQWKKGLITELELSEQMLLVLSMFQYELSAEKNVYITSGYGTTTNNK